jgi:hypothetical protein
MEFLVDLSQRPGNDMEFKKDEKLLIVEKVVPVFYRNFRNASKEKKYKIHNPFSPPLEVLNTIAGATFLSPFVSVWPLHMVPPVLVTGIRVTSPFLNGSSGLQMSMSQQSWVETEVSQPHFCQIPWLGSYRVHSVTLRRGCGQPSTCSWDRDTMMKPSWENRTRHN